MYISKFMTSQVQTSFNQYPPIYSQNQATSQYQHGYQQEPSTNVSDQYSPYQQQTHYPSQFDNFQSQYQPTGHSNYNMSGLYDRSDFPTSQQTNDSQYPRSQYRKQTFPQALNSARVTRKQGNILLQHSDQKDIFGAKQNSTLLQVPKSAQKSTYTSRKCSDTDDNHSQCSTQVDEMDNFKPYQGQSLNQKIHEKLENSSTQPQNNSDEIFYEEATCKKPKKCFKNEQDRDNFVKQYKLKRKTEMCRNWEMYGRCKFGETCSFAHGEHEIMRKSHLPSNYKTKPCLQFHTTAYCPYGNRCQFLHSQYDIYAKLEASQVLSENLRLSGERANSLIGGQELLSYVNVFSTRRLRIFEKLAPTHSGF